MIVDHISRLRQYDTVYPGAAQAADFLEKLDPATVVPGKYTINGEQVYAMVQQYETMPEETLLWEYHERYLDIQYILSGQEAILWADRGDLTDCSGFSKEKDSAVSSCKCDSTPVLLKAGQFAILAPQDAHKPKCTAGEACPVTKVVVKVALL